MVNDYGILIVQSSLFYGLIAVTNHRYRNDGRINIMKAPKKNPKIPKIVINCLKMFDLSLPKIMSLIAFLLTHYVNI